MKSIQRERLPKRRKMSCYSAVAVLMLMVSLLGQQVVTANTPGVSSGDSATFEYTIRTSYATPNGNHTLVQISIFTVDVISLNVSDTRGVITYSEKVIEFNNQSVTGQRLTINTTYFFDPFVNYTYLGSIGFYPFAYVDLRPGLVKDMPVSLSVAGPGGAAVKSTQFVDASVALAGSELRVNFTITANNLPPSATRLVYNASTGVLIYGGTFTHFFGIEKDFVYRLAQYTRQERPTQSPLQYLLPGVAILVVALIAIRFRPGGRRRLTWHGPKSRWGASRLSNHAPSRAPT